MSVRHCCNQSIRSNKRHVTTQRTSISGYSGETFTGENHQGMVAYDAVPPAEIWYPGYEHWPCGVLQYNENAAIN